jgi:hypothetical protein
VRGYVVAVGPRFFLLALVSDRIRFDGFECFRIADVRDIKPDPYSRFIEEALKRRGERMPTARGVSLGSIEDVILSAGRKFGLVTIHLEQVDAGVCWIGRVLGIEGAHVSILEIKPDATWEKKPAAYRLREITRVNFGGDYEGALALVSSAAKSD